VIGFITLGTVLGLSAGFAPGPLLALVISETLKHNLGAGIRVAIAPIITDLPIIAATLYLAGRLGEFNQALGLISLLGGCLLLYMGYQGIRTHGMRPDLPQGRSGSLTRGIMANALSPHPYLFWISVGAPIISKAMESGTATAGLFLGSFYLLLVGSKIVLALVVARSKDFLSGTLYLYIMRGLGVVLAVLGVTLFHDGLGLLQLL
jgi:threonine/homoserine/homoserine lactone efflux protein